MASPLFKAKFRIVENTKAEKQNDPTHKMPMEFTPEDARAAAQYLTEMAAKAESEGTTIRKYSGQNDYSEVPGFTCWLSMWDQSGSWSPMPLDPLQKLRRADPDRAPMPAEVAYEADIPF